MNLRNLFISSSKSINGFRARLLILAWMAIGLALFDAIINSFFTYPTDPKFMTPSRLQLYFEYGRSSEGKLARMTRCDPTQTAAITLTGWYEPLQVIEPTSRRQGPVVTFYGMSHAVRLAQALDRSTDHLDVRIVGAPGATGNWSLGAFLRDRGGDESGVVVLGLMSANLAMIDSVSPMTWNIDGTMPYTADRFAEGSSGLTTIAPPYESFEDYCDAFYDPLKWQVVRNRLQKSDPLFSSIIMETNLLDHSAIIRLLRRAYGQTLVFRARQSSMSKNGYEAHSEQVKTARAIVQEFAKEARIGGMIPIVYLANNLGYSDYLFQSLEPTLSAENILYLSSHTIADPSDPRNYLSDSHFTDEVDDKMARQLERIIEKAVTDLERRASP